MGKKTLTDALRQIVEEGSLVDICKGATLVGCLALPACFVFGVNFTRVLIDQAIYLELFLAWNHCLNLLNTYLRKLSFATDSLSRAVKANHVRKSDTTFHVPFGLPCISLDIP